jgi:hypothetical protein
MVPGSQNIPGSKSGGGEAGLHNVRLALDANRDVRLHHGAGCATLT